MIAEDAPPPRHKPHNGTKPLTSTTILSWRDRVHETLVAEPASGSMGQALMVAIKLLIALNVLAVVLESVPSLEASYAQVFEAFEAFSVAVFTVEYLLRVWAVTGMRAGAGSSTLKARLRYMVTPLALIDLVAILPFYLGLSGIADLRLLRILRLLRLLKLIRYSKSLLMLGEVMREEARAIWASLFVLMMLLLVSASLAYHAEHPAQPEVFSSIPQSLWWAVVTMTTIGYGDITPVTVLGKIIAGCVGIIGIGMVALPAGLLAAGFTKRLHDNPTAQHEQDGVGLDLTTASAAEKHPSPCPHCGHAQRGAGD